jgi:FKBP-type peptidyl-prolyl cis-trans isomerase FkpA
MYRQSQLNKMMRTTITLLAAVVLLASCNQYKKTPSGLQYKIVKGKSNEKIKQGQFVKFHIEYRLASKDSLLNSSYGHLPNYLVVDTARIPKHSFLELISQVAPGDKVEFVMSIDTLKKMGMIEYNNIFKAGGKISGKVDFLAAFTKQEDAMADNDKENKAEMAREVQELKDMAAKKGIKTQSTRSGALVEIQTPGDMTIKADSGTMAKVMYKGALANGTVFDTNIDPKNPNTPPLVVAVGVPGTQNSVITGMDEALRVFRKRR